MVSRATTVAFRGIETLDIDVQVHLANALPAFSIVGLPAKAVDESKDRVRSALSALGLSLPPKRITVNLAPADVVKEGSHYDLPIALGILAAMGVLAPEQLTGYVALGELALDGKLTEVAGVLPTAIGAASSGQGLICPAESGPEAAWADGLEIIAAPDLISLLNHFKGTQVLSAPDRTLVGGAGRHPDMRDIKGQETAKRALEIAASGRPQPADGGAAGLGKIHAGSTAPGCASRFGCGGGPGGQHDPERGGTSGSRPDLPGPSVPGPPSLQQYPGLGRWGSDGPSRRGVSRPPRRPVS